MDCIKRVLKDYLFPWFVFINNMKYEVCENNNSKAAQRSFLHRNGLCRSKSKKTLILKLLDLLNFNI